jgi:amidase
MKSNFTVFALALFYINLCLISCQSTPEYPEFETWIPYDETAILDSSQSKENVQLRYKRIQSLALDKNDLLKTIKFQLDGFTEEKYLELTPFIFENSILEIQTHIESGHLTYKDLTQWYLYRIAITETDKDLGLNAIVAINPDAVEQAAILDQKRSSKNHPIYGMPILLKDNINTSDMPTTAGAMALRNNLPNKDAFIVSNLKSNGAIILGKVNLSEWANFLCAGCPNGYSAIGGQTLNPYGPTKFDTGGSSSGSAVSVAVNYAVGAIGSETSGSILSPASQQSLVGLKPTVVALNQQGIIPISSTLDTPGPITRNVGDNAIIYSAMIKPSAEFERISIIENPSKLRLGAFKNYMQDSLYERSVNALKANGVQIEIIEQGQMDFGGFLALLNGDMKRDLKIYLNDYASDSVKVKSVNDVRNFNSKDSLFNIPYNQARLDGILEQEFTDLELDSIRRKLINSGRSFFDVMMGENNLDAVLSINNYNAGQAAVAKYPAITIPMGYTGEGEPRGLTIIAKSKQETMLLELANFYERISKIRITPESYTVQ